MTEQEKENYVQLVNTQYKRSFSNYESASKWIISTARKINTSFINIPLEIPMIAEAAKKRAEIEEEKEVERKKEEMGFPVFQQPEGIIHFEAIKGLYIPDIKTSKDGATIAENDTKQWKL